MTYVGFRAVFVFYAERGLTGGRFQPIGETAGERGFFVVLCEVDHGCDDTRSAGGLSSFFRADESPTGGSSGATRGLPFRTNRDTAAHRSCRRLSY